MVKTKEWSKEYLQRQYEAMCWLAEQGLTVEEIRNMRWGQVDEFKREIGVKRMVTSIKYDSKTGVLDKTQEEKEIPVKIEGKCSDFFLKSKICCTWMFTCHKPKTWRREGSREALFPVSFVKKIVQNYLHPYNISVLTNVDKFATIEVSKLNITKMKTKEQTEEAIVV